MTSPDLPPAAIAAARQAALIHDRLPSEAITAAMLRAALPHLAARDRATWRAGVEWAAQQAGSLKFTLYRPSRNGPGGGHEALDVVPLAELLGLLRQRGTEILEGGL